MGLVEFNETRTKVFLLLARIDLYHEMFLKQVTITAGREEVSGTAIAEGSRGGVGLVMWWQGVTSF